MATWTEWRLARIVGTVRNLDGCSHADSFTVPVTIAVCEGWSGENDQGIHVLIDASILLR